MKKIKVEQCVIDSVNKSLEEVGRSFNEWSNEVDCHENNLKVSIGKRDLVKKEYDELKAFLDSVELKKEGDDE